MEMMISCFQQIRNLKENMLPLSTALWGPKWYHNSDLRKGEFVDKRNIYNGLIFTPFVPGKSCEGLCDGSCAIRKPESCAYLTSYRKQLDALNFEDIIHKAELFGIEYITKRGITTEPVVVFMVYESPNNPCSERWVIKDWFQSHGIKLKEFNHTYTRKLF